MSQENQQLCAVEDGGEKDGHWCFSSCAQHEAAGGGLLHSSLHLAGNAQVAVAHMARCGDHYLGEF